MILPLTKNSAEIFIHYLKGETQQKKVPQKTNSHEISQIFHGDGLFNSMVFTLEALVYIYNLLQFSPRKRDMERGPSHSTRHTFLHTSNRILRIFLLNCSILQNFIV